MQRFAQFLHHHFVFLLASFISVCIGVAIAGGLAFGHHLIETQALQSSKAYLQTIRTAWTVYHDDVVQRLHNIDGVTVSPRYKTVVGGIPTPIAYTNQLAQQLQSFPGQPQLFIRSNTASDLSEEDSMTDPFQEKAKDYFSIHDDAFYEVAAAQGYQAFNYAEPIIMEASCVDCHQTLEKPDISEWDVGEVIGFLAVRQPLTSMIGTIHQKVQIIGWVSALLGGVGFIGSFFLHNQRKEAQQLLRDELEQKTIALERLDLTDALTQVANKGQFTKALNQEWRRVWRQHGHLSLLICDVDYFQQFNQTYGSKAGDKCLQRIAQTIQGQLKRAGDLVSRFQDDEFYILLPETTAAEAEEMAAILLDAIHHLRIVHAQSDVSPYVSISIGISSTIPAKDHHPDELIESAAKALYHEVKQSGRNDFAVHIF